ncbi:excinuclease ABC subunit UvrC [Selenomonadales bacterium OttesenSCG-928-I06]|nr:excinuclease ABC subunit UvrC [Selenomonadales bacterium OttesenSCG-928-I06]
MPENIKEKLKLLPNKPGTYLMKDAKGNIIYVGKAINLKNRVCSYFRPNVNDAPKLKALRAKIADFEYILTSSEIEALILECNLIKMHHPKYNISLKDDKSYPYIKLTSKEDFPRIFATRKIIKDGSKYFGPYTNAGAVHETIKLLKNIFPFRSCKTMNPKRPCLEYHIKRCLAPCTGNVTKEEYNRMIQSLEMFLEGRSDFVVKKIKEDMTKAAEDLKFEEAAQARDRLKAVEAVIEKQHIISEKGDQDILGLARQNNTTCIEVFFVRNGMVIGRNHFLLSNSEGESDEEVLTAFIKQYYNQATFIPKEILLPHEIKEEKELLSTWLSNIKGASVHLLAPQRGAKRNLLNMVNDNAKSYLEEYFSKNPLDSDHNIKISLEELAEHLELDKIPDRIECFDISHIQGAETVASMVVFENGVSQKNGYRRFKINSTEGKPDDFKSMQEVITRRYLKSTKNNPLPDLIIIDGGKGQLNAVLPIIKEAGIIDKVAVVALAERFEHLFKEGQKEPIVLPPESNALFLVKRIRDEAHRFAITYHRKLRSKRNLVSVLDHIDGVGSKRRKALLDHFKTISKIKEASLEELQEAPLMNKKTAETVYRFFQERKKHN